jgi:hypothetical protein
MRFIDGDGIIVRTCRQLSAVEQLDFLFTQSGRGGFVSIKHQNLQLSSRRTIIAFAGEAQVFPAQVTPHFAIILPNSFPAGATAERSTDQPIVAVVQRMSNPG